MDQKDAMLSDLRAQIVTKDVQLKAAVALAGRAASDLKKYRDLTVKLEGIREITLHQRRAHAEVCKDDGMGCLWDLGLLAYLAHSMGMKGGTLQMEVLKRMIDQYDAQHNQQGHVHQFPKGVTDAGRSVQPATEEDRRTETEHRSADVPGPRPDDQETRRRSDEQGSAPK